MNKKAQVWTIDLIAGVTIFLIMIVFYMIFTNNISSGTNLKEINNEAIVLSNTLLSAGAPFNWTKDNVAQVGITDGKYRLDEAKLQNASAIDYYQLKLLLKTKYDYLIFFEKRDSGLLNISGISYLGKEGMAKNNITSQKFDTLVSLKRFLIHNNEIITMVVYLWE